MAEVFKTTGRLAVVAGRPGGVRREKWMGTPAELLAILDAPSGSLLTEVTVTTAADGSQYVNIVWEPWS